MIKKNNYTVKNKSKCNSLNISNFNRSEKKKNNERLASKRNIINNKILWNIQQQEPLKNKIKKVLNKIKSIEEKNFTKLKPSSKSSIIRNKTGKNNNNYSQGVDFSKDTFKKINYDRYKNIRNNHLTINNNFYTIINNMTINSINDMDKINKNINFTKNDFYSNYNGITNYKSLTSKKESDNIFFLDNEKIRSRNQSNILKNYKDKSNVSNNENNTKFKYNISTFKNQSKKRVNKSYNEKNNLMNINTKNNKKRNIKITQNKNISLKEKIHLFHQKKESLIKQYLNRRLVRNVYNNDNK